MTLGIKYALKNCKKQQKPATLLPTIHYNKSLDIEYPKFPY